MLLRTFVNLSHRGCAAHFVCAKTKGQIPRPNASKAEYIYYILSSHEKNRIYHTQSSLGHAEIFGDSHCCMWSTHNLPLNNPLKSMFVGIKMSSKLPNVQSSLISNSQFLFVLMAFT